MQEAFYLGLLHNAALLLMMVLLYDVAAYRGWPQATLVRQLAHGFVLGGLGMLVMLTPCPFTSGVVFDTRSVLLGITGLFFGTVPAVVAMAMTAALRLYDGGSGALTGTAVILASGTIGVAWRRLRRGSLCEMSGRELFLFGIVVHVVMLALMLTLPWDTAVKVLSKISLPVMAIYPLTTALLGTLMVNRFRRERADVERKQAGEALRTSQEQLAMAIEGSGLGLWDWRVQTGKTTFNEQWANIIGYTLSELEPVSIETWMRLTHPDDLRKSQSALDRHFAGEMPAYECEARMRHKDGHWVWILDRGKVTEWDSSGKPVRMTGTHLDITERKRVEAALLKARDDAEAANRAKSAFLATMSHELRTPMNAIMGFTELTLQSGLTQEQRKFLGIVRTRSKDLLVLLSDILDMSKIEAERMELVREPFSVAQLVSEVIEMMALPAGNKNLYLEKRTASDLPAVVYGDAQRLRQVLVNLLGNAVKFTDNGGVRVLVERDTNPNVAGDHVMLHFSVQDTGIGIAADKMGDIFKSFVQVDNSNARKYGGAGLGLAIVKRLVEMMGGSVWVESEIGKGSTFQFTVRLSLHAAQGINPETIPLARQASFPRRLRILVVEDDECSSLLAIQILKNAGHDSAQASTGQAALDALTRSDFDLVLMDVKMPGMDGLEATRQIRNPQTAVRNHRIPVIALTAHAMKEDEAHCLQAGMNAYIAKPVTHSALLSIVERVMV